MQTVMSRVAARRNMDEATRLTLLEGDADEFEQGLGRVAKTLDRILWTLVGLLVSVTTGGLLLALNLVVST